MTAIFDGQKPRSFGYHSDLQGFCLVQNALSGKATSNAYRCPAGEMLTAPFHGKEVGLLMSVYWSTACQTCPLKTQCTKGKERRIKRWEHESLVEAMAARMQAIDAMAIRRETVEHPFSTIKAWMGFDYIDCGQDRLLAARFGWRQVPS